jgi:anaerobic selenocysteine-containing dehydrogenase
MMSEYSRRNFLKISSAAATVTGIAAAARQIQLEPYVQTPEDVLPGKGTWYASTCMACPAGCGTIIRVINGRPRKIEGNPIHPVNRGKLCARGQAVLQDLYDPDRLKSAVHQSGGRGSRRFEAIRWDDAIAELAERLDAISDPNKISFILGMVPDHLYQLVGRFLDSLGAPGPVVYDLHSIMESRTYNLDLAERWFGTRRMPYYDIAHTEVIFSFGSNFLGTWNSPVAQAVDYGRMRQGLLGSRGYVVHFEPRLSSTAAVADEWVPISPGTEGLVALGIGRIIVEESLGRVGGHREHAEMYRDVSVGEIAQASGISTEELLRFARIFAGADQSFALGGGYLGGLSNGEEALDAIMALNVTMRRIGREGGLFFPQEVPAVPFTQPIQPSSFTDFTDLISRMHAGEVDLLFIHSANPLYDLPQWSGIAEALSRVPQIVSFSPIVDETSVYADWILPDHTDLEGWGYRIVTSRADRPVVSNRQPVSQPLYETHSTADLILTLARRLLDETDDSFPWQDEAEFLEAMASDLLGSSIALYDARTASSYWSRWRQYGGWWSENPILMEPSLTGKDQTPLKVPNAEFSGQKSLFPFHLYLYESITLSDGRGANKPWLQETPDPMTTARWNTWVEINPQTAESLGVEDNDVVKLRSEYAEIEAIVVVFPGIRPDVIAVPLGQGHSDLGRFASDRGTNAFKLVAPNAGAAGEQLLWSSTRVQVIPQRSSARLARLESLDGEGRENLR